MTFDPVLVSHSDNDHYSRATCKNLKSVCKEYHTTFYVASLMKEECNIDGTGSGIHNLPRKEKWLTDYVYVELACTISQYREGVNS